MFEILYILLQEAHASMEAALIEESAQRNQPISILTDARHGWRKNSRQTDVVCLGAEHKRIISIQTVTHSDDPVAQRHERIGTVRIHDDLAQRAVSICKHCHDNNASINKLVREQHPEVINQLDTWHGVKSLVKALTAISQGAKKS